MLKRFLFAVMLALLFALFMPSDVHAQCPPGYYGPACSQGGGGITPVTTLPGTCTPGQAFLLPGNVTVFCGSTANTFFADGVQAINMLAYGVKADLRTCIGVGNLTTSNGSPTLTCIGGNFCNGSTVACPAGQTTDVGKRINGTSGCCNLSLPSGNTQTIPNNTTILSVQSATQITMSANATGTSNYAFWATDDDAAVALADAAYVAAPASSTLLFPATPFLVKNPHFNTPNAQCEDLESGGVTGRLFCSSYFGWGSNNSVMYLDASLNANTPCPTAAFTGCFFSQGVPVHMQHIGISGGWNQVPNGGGHSYVLIYLGSGSQMEDVRAVGFSAADGATFGMRASSFSNFLDTYFTGFGFNGVRMDGASSVFRGGEVGNVGGFCFDVEGSAGVSPVITHGMSFGTCGSGTVKVGGGPWTSTADLLYGQAAGGTCLWATGAGVAVFMTGGIIGSNGNCSTNAILTSGTATVTLTDMFVNANTNAINITGGGKVISHGGNTITGGLTPTGTGVFAANPSDTYSNAAGILPTCSSTGLTQSACALVAGSTNEKGTIRVTAGGVGGAFTETLTFAGAYSGPTGAAPVCVFMYSNTGSASWTAPTLLTISSKSTSAYTIAGSATTVNASTYDMSYNCTAQ
jgi:hypothetical protein